MVLGAFCIVYLKLVLLYKTADKQLNVLGQFDNSRADTILINLIELLKSEEKSDFFFALFENNFSKLDYSEMQLILSKVDKEYKKLMIDKIINEEDENK